MSTTVFQYCVVFFAVVSCVLGRPQEVEQESTKEPEFLSKALSLIVKRGETVTLPCEVNNIGKFAMLWNKESAILFVSGDGKFIPITKDERFSTSDYDLIIENINANDTGKYICSLSTPNQKKLVHILQVEQEPVVQAAREEVIEAKGSSAMLSCEVVKGVPEPSISWRKDGVDLEWTGPEITIETIDQRNAGNYTCIASNGVGKPSSADIYLSVMFPPEITVQKEWIHSGEGYQAEIACIISGEPKPIVEWYRNDQKLNVEGSGSQYKVLSRGSAYTLHIDQLKDSDFGKYTCRAKNEQGDAMRQIELTGIAKTVNFTSPRDGESDNEYRLTWEVESYSKVTSYKLKYRKVKFNETSDEPGEWMERSVTPSSPVSGGFIHQKAEVLGDLDPATQYDAVVQVQNKFGWNEESEPFRFATRGATVVVESGDPDSGMSLVISPIVSVILPLLLSLVSLL